MRIVVTGGAGFIGSHIVEELLSRNAEIIIIDNLRTGSQKTIEMLRKIGGKNLSFVFGSVTNLKLLKKVFKKIDYVIHLAAEVSVKKSIERPIHTSRVNIGGTLNVLTAARDREIEKVIYASSSAVYGDCGKLPMKENMLPKPISPYGVSKLVGEYYCELFSKIYGLKTISLRYFNVYGPRQNPFSEYAAVIPRFIVRILQNKNPIIYGNGQQTRDFVYIKDVVDANILAIEKNNVTGIFNIGSGKEITIQKLAYKIIELMGKKVQPVYAPARKGDVLYSSCDISLAKKHLNYHPKYSLEEGLKNTIKYYQSNLKSL